MRLSVWNPLGAKRCTFWQYYMQSAPNGESVVVVGQMSRLAGCAPWIKSDEVTIYNVYPGPGFSQRYQPNIAKQYDAMIVDDIDESRRWKAFWVPCGRGSGR